MKYLCHNILFIILAVVNIARLEAAPPKDSQVKLSLVESMSIANGLSDNGVTTIYNDSRGYLWIATYDGLNCYNGHVVTIYKNSVNNMFLPSNRIRAIAEDAQGRLWIGTDEGLVVYDYALDKFIIGDRFSRGGIIRKILIVDDLAYIISESKGVLVYDMRLGYVCRDSLSEPLVFTDAVVSGGSLLIASSQGVVSYDMVERKFNRYFTEGDFYLNAIISSSTPGIVYAGTTAGLLKINVVQASQGSLALNIVERSYRNSRIISLAEDENNRIWIGTAFGGFFCDEVRKGYVNQQNRYLDGNRVSKLLSVENGNLWVSTFDRGVYSYTFDDEMFKSPVEDRALKMTLINFIDENRLMVKSDKIIHLYNIASGEYETTPKVLQDLFNQGHARHFVDSKQRIWVISLDGCYFYDLNTDKVNFVGSHPLLASKKILPTAASQDGDGNIWLGYVNDILKLYLDEDETIKHVESICSNDYFKSRDTRLVRVIYHDDKTNRTWIGTDLQGLFVVPTSDSLPQARIEHYTRSRVNKRSISSSSISTFMRDNSGVMWVGTEQGGICRVDESGDMLSFKCYTEENGLSNNLVKSILCDSNNLLWITTNLGLNSFDPITEQFHAYRVADGLPFDEFLYSSAQSQSGELFFTGLNQFMYFTPERLPQGEPLPKLYFSGLKIYDQAIKPNVSYENRVILKQRLKSGDSFTLEHDQNTFSVVVDAIYNQNTSYHHYHYILEPANSKWIKTHVSNNEIAFNGLQPGKYTLRVMASNSYGEMTPEQQLYIRIKRPILGSVVAYIIYAMLLIAIISLVVYFMMHTQALRHKLTLEAQDKESLSVANLEKQRYFSNISHELKTPLTLIVAPLAILAERFKLDLNVNANLAVMQRQVRKMLQLIDLAHGIQLSDENLLVLKQERFVMRDLLKEISDDFEFLSRFDKKQFTVEYPSQVLSVVADRGMLEKIFNNLLNNAFKYTVAGDSIMVSYLYRNEMLIVKVADSGAGIQAEDIPRIFDRFYTSKSIETKKVGGTGIGLAFSKYMVELHGGVLSVESEYGKGTTFTIELPIVEVQHELADYSLVADQVDQRSLILGSLELGDEIEVNPLFKDRLVYMVEDNGEMRAFISEIIARYFIVKSYASAAECLSAMESQWPDIIVSDVMMPDMDGDKMCEIIKSDIRTSHIPIILLTARYSVDDKIKGIELGADSYIGKPFYPKHLITRINALLNSRQRLVEQFQKGISFVQSAKNGTISSRDSELLSSLYAIFDKNLDNESIELDSFAVELGLNRSSFYSKIKALTDMSPYELLKIYRLQQAKVFILSGSYNISEVCYMTGFKSQSHFSRVFKQHFGVSPSKVFDTKE